MSLTENVTLEQPTAAQPTRAQPTVNIAPHPCAQRVLTPEAVAFLLDLHSRFEPARARLLAERAARQERFDRGERPGFLAETAAVRAAEWQVAPAPAPLSDRRVEITGPPDRKMLINALNSGASVFMADFEDACSPTWENVLTGQINLADAVRATIAVTSAGQRYRLRADGRVATLLVRPRGWHLPERHLTIDGQPISASLFDFGLYVFHNAKEAIARGQGPYFYLPKLEGHHGARLWNEVMAAAEAGLDLPRGSIRPTVLIETITAAFEMDEILYELRERICGLNAGRWDYIFSVAKRFHADPTFVLGDRASVTMTVPFMRAYTELLVKSCHRRGAHAIGGMAAFIPNRRQPAVSEAALAQVAQDKRREAGDGFDGTWVAHPDLVPTARAEFDAVLGQRPHQIERQRPEVEVVAGDLLAVDRSPRTVTMAGLELNVDVGIRYLASWLCGVGAAAINDLMEDAATAEISRAQVWQWVHHSVELAPDGPTVTAALVRELLDRTLVALAGGPFDAQTLFQARRIFELVALGDHFLPFLTLPAYELLG